MESQQVEYAAWIGLDWGGEQHSVCLQATDSSRVEHDPIDHTPEALGDWFLKLQRRFGGRKVAIALEQSKGAVINFLLGFDFVCIYPINPASLRSYGHALYLSGAKDDPTDAELLMQFLKMHWQRMRPWVPDDPESRALLRLVEFRRKTIGHRTALTNALTQQLKEYFPQALQWAGDLNRVMACDFLERWPNLEKIKRARAETIRKFYRQHRYRRLDVIEQRCQDIQLACPLTSDSAVIETSVLMVLMHVSQLRALIKAIEVLDKRIAEIFKRHPDFEIFASFPGAGPALAPRLQAAMGCNRSRFGSSQEVAQYSGIAPVTERSGKVCWIHRRWACSRFVKQSFHEFAGQSVLQSDWARAYYDMQRAKGKGHHAAVRALAYKWIRIIYKCWNDQKPYSDSKYMQSLRSKGVAYIAHLGNVA